MDKKDRVKEELETREVLGYNVMSRRDFLRVLLCLSFTLPFYAPTILGVLSGSTKCSRKIPFSLRNGSPTHDPEKDLSWSGIPEKGEKVLASGPVNGSFIFPREASYYRNLAG